MIRFFMSYRRLLRKSLPLKAYTLMHRWAGPRGLSIVSPLWTNHWNRANGSFRSFDRERRISFSTSAVADGNFALIAS